MYISKPVKVIIGVLTLFAVLFPFLIVPGFFMIFFVSTGLLSGTSNYYRGPGEFMFPFMLLFYPTMFCYSFVQLGLQVFYIIHQVKNKVLTDTYQILFALGTFLLPYIAMPIYFFAYLWKDAAPETPLTPQTDVPAE